jgi:hypothetical protein
MPNIYGAGIQIKQQHINLINQKEKTLWKIIKPIGFRDRINPLLHRHHKRRWNRLKVHLFNLIMQEPNRMPTSKFKKGTSGNPAGRPAGKTPGAKLRKAIEAQADNILQSVIDAAVAGDMAACKMLLDRITPTLKPTASPVNIDIGATLPETGGNVLAATMSGAVPPDVGSMLITALANQGKLVELQEITDRLQRIEKQLDGRK